MAPGACKLGLYLHGGPGLTADVERTWFGDDHPLDWWNQPHASPDDPRPFDSLFASAKGRLAALSRSAGKPVSVVSHLVGSVIATMLIRDASEHIAVATLINPVFDLADALIAVAHRMAGCGMLSNEQCSMAGRVARGERWPW